MKATVLLLALLALAIPARSETKTRTVSFMPSQAVDVPNDRWTKIEIHSEFPLRILTRGCENNYTVEFVCTLKSPADIFVEDMRTRPLVGTPRANQVTFTLSTGDE